jgi:hypothetical protein
MEKAEFQKKFGLVTVAGDIAKTIYPYYKSRSYHPCE